jgi:hypothetical protein
MSSGGFIHLVILLVFLITKAEPERSKYRLVVLS